MRVALVCPLFESVPPKLYGGTERVVYNLARGLLAAGIEVTLFASGDSQCAGAQIISPVEQALRLRAEPVLDPHAYTFQMLAEVARRAGSYDLIHNHHDYWMLPLQQMVDTPLLTTLHGRLDFIGHRAAFSGYTEANYLSISDAQRNPLPELNWLRTIRHGIEPTDFKFHPEPGKYLAFLGRISSEKRPEWAIALAKASGVPLKIAAKIDGREGQDYYDAFVAPEVDGKFIEYVGEISESEKSDFLGNALALAFPIDWPEPFGLVVIEALACGTPVLARPFGSVPEIMRDGLTGFVEQDLMRLAARVRDIPKINRGSCRRWVEERFSLKRMTEDHIHVYRNLIDARNKSGRDESGRDESGRIRGPLRERRQTHSDRRDFIYPVERLTQRNS